MVKFKCYSNLVYLLSLVSFVGCPGVLLTKIWQGPSVRIVYFLLHISVASVSWEAIHNVPYHVAGHVLGLVSFVDCPSVLLTKIWHGPSVMVVYFCLHISVASVSWGTRHNVPCHVASHVLGLVSFVGCPGVLLTKIWQGPSVRIVYFVFIFQWLA